MSQSTTNVKELPEFSRHITTHDADGVAVFQTPDPDADDLSAAATSCPAPPISTFPTWTNYPGSAFGLAYATATIPADCNANADLEAYYQYLHSHPGITIKGGSVLRVVDMAPGTISPMHRTVSLDYGVVLEGEVELELDSADDNRCADPALEDPDGQSIMCISNSFVRSCTLEGIVSVFTSSRLPPREVLNCIAVAPSLVDVHPTFLIRLPFIYYKYK
ncbi:hypothetical protein KCU88_g23, partial [Aureobasidium melanogenum]